MKNTFFQFKQFRIEQDKAAMKVTTDGCLFGAWVSKILKHNPVKKILDIGTGTGLLSLMIAQHNNNAIIDAVEIEKGAAMQANENFERSAWNERLTVINEDIRKLSPVNKYDVIISNPPFYQGELSSPSSIKNIAHHDEGLLAEELLKIIRHHLDKNGRFFLLLPFKRFAELTAGCSLNNLFISKIIKIRSFNDGPVSRFMVEGGLMQTTMETSEINIYGMNKEYSNEFKELLAPFYLNL